MSIQQVVNLIEAKLLEDADWGNSIFWGNLNSFQNDYQDADCPVTVVHLESASMVESSTQSDQTEWSFTIRGIFYLGEKITTKAQILNYETYNNSLTTIYNNIVDGLDCAWVTDFLRTDFESIDERFSVIGRFNITVENIR